MKKQDKINEESKAEQEEVAETPEVSDTEELNRMISEKDADIARLEKLVSDWKTKAENYLSTASYYKTQAETNKADFDRYKERNKNIETEAALKADAAMAKRLIPILDHFNSAMAVLDSETMKGFIMIYTSLLDALKDIGVTDINPKGEKLDPERHNCIDITETDDESLDGTVAKVYQKGYIIESQAIVIRPANVSVYKFNKT